MYLLYIFNILYDTRGASSNSKLWYFVVNKLSYLHSIIALTIDA